MHNISLTLSLNRERKCLIVDPTIFFKKPSSFSFNLTIQNNTFFSHFPPRQGIKEYDEKDKKKLNE